MNVVELIQSCAKVPSFSTYEERLHPLILDILSEIKGVKIDKNLRIKLTSANEHILSLVSGIEIIGTDIKLRARNSSVNSRSSLSRSAE